MSLCDGFFDCGSVLSKSVAEMTFNLAYVLNVASVALYHVARCFPSMLTTVLKRVRLNRNCNTITFTVKFSIAYFEALSSPEAALLLVSTKNRHLQEGPAQEVFRRQNWKNRRLEIGAGQLP